MVTLHELQSALGDHLLPAGAPTRGARPLTGVHISELEDPTPYLDGGELLLTTGMPLGSGEATLGAYVDRLRDRGVPALGIGLGPWLTEVPDVLVDACAAAGVDLFTVPDGVPFQSVSRAFWDLTARDGQADLMASLGTQTALTQAAGRPEAVAAVVRGVAQALGGWAAYLSADSAAATATYWPPQTEAWLPVLRAQTRRFHPTGGNAPATFELHGQPVVEHPIVSGERTHGFLAVGPGRALTAADRQVITTVCTLLALKARQRELAAGTRATLGAVVAKLVLRGQVEAARLLAEDVGLHDLPPRVRLLALRAGPDDDVDAVARAAAFLEPEAGLPALGSAPAECLLRHHEDGVLHLLLPADLERAGEPPLFADMPSGLAGVLSDPVGIESAGPLVPSVRRAARQAAAGTLVGTGAGEEPPAEAWVRTLEGYPRADLVGTVAAYLRHRGHWEEVSRALGVHRNSVRHRIGVARDLLGVDLDDPDVFAPLWLALRAREG